MNFINGYRALGVVQLTRNDFDDIPELDRNLDGFDTVSQKIVFQLKFKISNEWYFLEIFQQDNRVNTGITKIEIVDNY